MLITMTNNLTGRVRQEMTVEQFGVSGQQISRFMTGRRTLTLRSAEKPLPVLGLVVSEKEVKPKKK